MRAVLDPNVIISALLAPGGPPARVLRAWLDGAYELVVSPLLLGELDRALAYPKLRKRVTQKEAAELTGLLGREARVLEDPPSQSSIRSPDPGDEYLIALAEAARAVIVSGDGHLLGLAAHLPVHSPVEFLDLLENS